MAAVDFPNSPTLNQEFTAGTTIYKWNGTVWEVKQSTLSSSSFSDSTPVMDGSASAGTSLLASRSDHIHPSDTSKASITHASSHGSAGSDPITIAQSQVTNLTTDLSAKAPLASPALTGIPTAPTAAATTNTTQIATTAFVRTEVSNLVDSAPIALDTLNELAAALGDDPNFATTVNTALSNRVLTTGGSTVTVASGTTVPLTIQNNGTGNSFVVNDEASDSNPFVIDASGNVGIGTASPLRKLDILGGGMSFTDANGAARTIHWGDSLTNTFPVTVTGVATSGNGYIAFGTNTFGNSSTERMRIDSSGNVGIGTTSLTDFSLTIKGNSISNPGNSRILAYSGTAASPSENADWPTPVLSLRTFGDFYLNSMLSFGYSNDSEYKTDGSVWAFRLEDTAGGTTPSRTTSSSTTALQLTGPGTLFFDAARIRLRNNAVLESPIVTNAQTASYTLALSDAGKLIEINSSSATTLTIPADAALAFPVGTKIDVLQTGTGQITIAGSGFTPNATPGLKISAQWGAASLIKRGTNSWVVVGSLSA